MNAKMLGSRDHQHRLRPGERDQGLTFATPLNSSFGLTFTPSETPSDGIKLTSKSSSSEAGLVDHERQTLRSPDQLAIVQDLGAGYFE